MRRNGVEMLRVRKHNIYCSFFCIFHLSKLASPDHLYNCKLVLFYKSWFDFYICTNEWFSEILNLNLKFHAQNCFDYHQYYWSNPRHIKTIALRLSRTLLIFFASTQCYLKWVWTDKYWFHWKHTFTKRWNIQSYLVQGALCEYLATNDTFEFMLQQERISIFFLHNSEIWEIRTWKRAEEKSIAMKRCASQMWINSPLFQISH